MIFKPCPLIFLKLIIAYSVSAFCAQVAFAKPAFHQQDVFYAGLAYLGDYQYIDKNYPATRQLNGETNNTTATLDRALVALIKKKPPKNFNLRYDLANLNQSQTVVMAVALDKELVSREVLKNDNGYLTKIILDITLQVLFYDFESMSLVDNYSITSAINHTVSGNQTNIDAEVSKLAKKLYLGDSTHAGILKEISDKIAALTPRAIDSLRFQLSDIQVHDRVKSHLPQTLSTQELQQYLGQHFSTQLSAKSSVNVLPYTRGYALGNQLPGRFSNGEVFNLKMPDADYEFNLEVKNLIHKKTTDSSLFGSQMKFSMFEPLSHQTYINDDFRYGIYKLEADNQVVKDDWSAYEDAMEALIDELVEQLKQPDKSWHKKHARSQAASYQQFNTKVELFNE